MHQADHRAQQARAQFDQVIEQARLGGVERRRPGTIVVVARIASGSSQLAPVPVEASAGADSSGSASAAWFALRRCARRQRRRAHGVEFAACIVAGLAHAQAV